MRNIFSNLFRFLSIWVFNSLCLVVCIWLLPGMNIEPNNQLPISVNIMTIGLIFTLMNLLVRPILLLLTLPLNGLTFGLSSLVINALVLYLVQEFSNLFTIQDFGTAFIASFLIAGVNIIFSNLIPLDEDMVYYDFAASRFSRKSEISDLGKKGLVILEIDGLSFSRINKAISHRKMPYLKELVDSGAYAVTKVDCGIPSQTSSCQAGIMYGNNHNICAYRWYDKKNKKIISSGSFQDTHEMEKKILTEQNTGLLDNGKSISNLMSGNADVSLFTVSSIQPKDNDERNKRNLDLFFFSLKPYLLTKSVIFTILDAIAEVFQYTWAFVKRKNPRLNRLNRFYPFIRGFTNVFLRDAATTMTINEIARSGPASYTTFFGYDEIAHHSGPDSYEAFHSLVGIDHSIQKIHQEIENHTERQYEMYVISDHGQSFGKTFKQRYGISLGHHIRDLAADCEKTHAPSQVIGIGSTSDNDSSIRAALTTLSGQEQTQQIPFSGKTFELLEESLEKESDEAKIPSEKEPNNIWVMVSGNLANIYFSFSDEKLEYQDLEEKYPNLCRRIIEHPGIGVMLVHENGQSLAYGKNGSRNLTTGEIAGEDPLHNYGPEETRAAQLSYLSAFPEGGDLVLFSTVYPDGTVAAFEELIGSHGGMGGQQNDAFIFHPANVEIPDNIQNSSEVYHVLKNRREQNAEAVSITESAEDSSKEWTWNKLVSGIKDTQKWTALARNVILFQSTAFRKISLDPSLNGPGLLIFLGSLLSTSFAVNALTDRPKGFLIGAVFWLIIWVISIAACYLAVISLRKQIVWTAFFRCIMFCSIFDLLWFGALIFGYADFWILMINVFRIISISLAVYGMADIQGRMQLLILPAVIIMVGICFLALYLVTESLGYLLNNEYLLFLVERFNETIWIP